MKSDMPFGLATPLRSFRHGLLAAVAMLWEASLKSRC